MAKVIAKAGKAKVSGKAGKVDRKPVKADARKGSKGKVAKVAERRPPAARECAVGVELAPGQMQGTGIYIGNDDKVTGLPADNPAQREVRGKPSEVHGRWAATLAWWRKRKGKAATVADVLAVKGGLHRGDLRHWCSKGFVKIGGKVEFVS